MADSNKPEWFSLSGNYFEETAIALGNSAYKDVKITLSDDPERLEYRLHKVILAASSSFFRSLFFYDPKEAYDIGRASFHVKIVKSENNSIHKLLYFPL